MKFENMFIFRIKQSSYYIMALGLCYQACVKQRGGGAGGADQKAPYFTHPQICLFFQACFPTIGTLRGTYILRKDIVVTGFSENRKIIFIISFHSQIRLK